MKYSLNNTTLYLLIAIVGYTSYAYAAQDGTQAEEADYSETQWRTFYGEKPADYRPEFWVTYYGAEDKEECYRPNAVSAVDGESRIKQKIYKEFLAEESNGGKNYVIRYPNKFRLGNCLYSGGGGQLYIEEKSDDPRLTQEPYISKTQIHRRTIVRGARVASVSLANDSELDELRKGNMYSNKSNLNIFCYKNNRESSFKINGKPLLLKEVNCFSSSIEEQVKKFLAYSSYIVYTTGFWKQNPNIEISFRMSNQIYCTQDKYCQSSQLPKLDENVIEPEKFAELYHKGDE